MKQTDPKTPCIPGSHVIRDGRCLICGTGVEPSICPQCGGKDFVKLSVERIAEGGRNSRIIEQIVWDKCPDPFHGQAAPSQQEIIADQEAYNQRVRAAGDDLDRKHVNERILPTTPAQTTPDTNERIGEFRCDDCGRHLANFIIMFKPGQSEAIESIKIRCNECGAEPWPEGHAEGTIL